MISAIVHQTMQVGDLGVLEPGSLRMRKFDNSGQREPSFEAVQDLEVGQVVQLWPVTSPAIRVLPPRVDR